MLELDHTCNASFELFHLRGLPQAYDNRSYKYEITRWLHNGRIEATSRGEGNGSVRHYTFKTLDEAFSHALMWGKRRIAEKQRAEAKQNEQLAAVLMSQQTIAA
jgi:hypothetical protein